MLYDVKARTITAHFLRTQIICKYQTRISINLTFRNIYNVFVKYKLHKYNATPEQLKANTLYQITNMNKLK